MKPLAPLALVFGALVTLSGCGGTATATSAAPAAASSSAAAASSASSASTPAPASSSAAPAAPVAGANTPDGVATNFLRALAKKDSATICNSLAVAGTPMNASQATLDRCATTIMPQVLQLLPAELAAMADQLSVTGATISGTKANYLNATVTPAEAKQTMASLAAIQVNGQWYIAVGGNG